MRTRTRKLKPWWFYLLIILTAITYPVFQALYQIPQLQPFCLPVGIAMIAIVSGVAGIIHNARHERRMKLLETARDLYALSPTDFEHYVGRLFQKQGYQVRHTGGKNDGGIDLRIEKDRERAIVQCKCYHPDRHVGPEVVRELHGALARERRASRAYLVTTSSFTPGAKSAADAAPIVLIDGQRLAAKVKQLGLPGEINGHLE